MKKIYLAGPMRHIPEFNFPAFHAAAKILRQIGYEVFSPAEKDNERHGTDISKGNATGDESYANQQHGFSLREALGIDLDWICAHADIIALLPGWEQSNGARAEHAAAMALGLEVMHLPGKPPKRVLAPAYIAKVEAVVLMVRDELLSARSKFGAFRSTHEGLGVIDEEWAEMRDEIYANDTEAAGKEAIQVAAMAASFVVDLCEIKRIPDECTREGACGIDHASANDPLPCNGTERRDP